MTLRKQHAIGQERRVPALAQHLGTAGGEVGGVGNDRALGVITDVIRCGVAEHRIEPDQQIIEVRGAEDPHVGDAAHERHVLDALMGRAVGLRDEAREAPDQLDGQARDPDIDADELEGPLREKARERVDDGDAASERQSRRHPDQGLLGDPDIDEARPQALGQGPDRGPVLGRHDDDALVFFGETVQGVFVTGQSEFSRVSSAPPLRPKPVRDGLRLFPVRPMRP